ncbi:MAG TPA: hypothetical protein VJ963_08690 [Bacteroidales bacterium]|nr:hypothetical protein [Bacteroidales bacterium]
MELYYQKDHYANSNTNGQTGDVDKSEAFVSDQASQSGFEIMLEHKRIVLNSW